MRYVDMDVGRAKVKITCVRWYLASLNFYTREFDFLASAFSTQSDLNIAVNVS
jgi:hypothetical protein